MVKLTGPGRPIKPSTNEVPQTKWASEGEKGSQVFSCMATACLLPEERERNRRNFKAWEEMS